MTTGSDNSDSRVQKALQVLLERSSCTLPELANCCRISSSRLSHLFKDRTGLSVKEYRCSSRLAVAINMLAASDMSVKEIAYHLGYRHPSSFVRAFKAHMGVSPSRYRNGNSAKAA